MMVCSFRTLALISSLVIGGGNAWATDAPVPKTPSEAKAAEPALDAIKKLDRELDGILGQHASDGKDLLTSQSVQTGLPEIVVYATAKTWHWTFKFHDLRNNEMSATVLTGGNLLIFPKGAVVHVSVTSDDVIHPFRVPELKIAKDGIPGRLSTIAIDTSRVGQFRSVCDATCGDHADDMAFVIQIASPNEYDRWLASLMAK